jgi:hypothetical protein
VRIRTALLLPLLAALSGTTSGCGGDETPSPALALVHPLVFVSVSGTDREMGLAHGRALAKEIAFVVRDWWPRWLRSLTKDAADAKATEDILRVYAKTALPLLPAGPRAELEGIAEGSGVPFDDLWLVEVAREGLRFHVKGSLVGASTERNHPLRSPTSPTRTGNVSTTLYGAPLALEPLYALVERKPQGGRSTVSFGWPGSLGGFVVASDRGLCAAAGEVDRGEERRSMNGVPFPGAMRIAVERAATAAEAWEALPRLSGHAVLVVDATGEGRAGIRGLADSRPAVVGVDDWVAFEPPEFALSRSESASDVDMESSGPGSSVPPSGGWAVVWPPTVAPGTRSLRWVHVTEEGPWAVEAIRSGRHPGEWTFTWGGGPRVQSTSLDNWVWNLRHDRSVRLGPRAWR